MRFEIWIKGLLQFYKEMASLYDDDLSFIWGGFHPRYMPASQLLFLSSWIFLILTGVVCGGWNALDVNCQTNKFKQVCLVDSCSSPKLYPTKMRNTFLDCLVLVIEGSKLILNKCVFDGDIENWLEANWILKKPLLAPFSEENRNTSVNSVG